MTQKWNLQDIRPAGATRERSERDQIRRPQQDINPRRSAGQTEPELDADLASIDIVDGKSQRRKRIIVSFSVSALIIGLAFFVNILLGGAEVVVYPKFKNASVQATFTAYTEPQVGELSYELLTLEATGERQVKATGQETVSERATGAVFIYNSKTTTQRLIKNTRFESPDGLIFRINESVEVPAASKDANEKIVPGIISVNVFADATGEQYNLGPTRFTIPGLKGRPEYDALYGESTIAFSGGFEGNKYIIDPEELQKSLQELHLELRNSLLERLKTERPLGFIVYDNAVTFSFESLPATTMGDDLANIKEKAYLSVPLLKEAEFARYLAESTVAGFEGEEVTLTNPLTLEFAYTESTTTTTDIRANESLTFNLKGTTQIVWKFDESKLAHDLASRNKTAIPNVLSAYSSIEKANATIRPFWKQNFPENANDILIKTIIGESVD